MHIAEGFDCCGGSGFNSFGLGNITDEYRCVLCP